MLIYRLPGSLDEREAEVSQLWEAGALGLEERTGFVRAYFESEVPLDLGGEWTEEPDQDWQEGWKAGLAPVTAGRLTVVPPWLADAVPPGQLPLIIEPGMAFGTGHHATTRLALEALSGLDVQGKRVLDVGSGSGVLAIGARLLGAASALGLDIDPAVIAVAHENAAVNGLEPGEALAFREGTLADVEDAPPFEVLVANLFAELHEALADDYLRVTVPGSPVILTGILEGKLAGVRAALEGRGFEEVASVLDGEWALLTARTP